METWFAIQFADGSTGFMHLIDGNCQSVYRADGTPVTADEHVEYTCVNDNASAPSWYVPPVVESPAE